MKVAFVTSEKARERELAGAFIAGVRACGDTGRAIRAGADIDFAKWDAVAMVGVKSRDTWYRCRDAGLSTIMLDKGYLRHRREDSRVWEYWRVAVNAHHPTRYLMARCQPMHRAEALGLVPAPWRERGDHIVIAGSSAKYHAFHSLPDPTLYAEHIVHLIRRRTSRPIVYRPKPSWRAAVPIDGTRFSPGSEPITDVLDGAHALVTHGSNACFEAVRFGVPCIVLGDAVARPISSATLEEMDAPRMASDADRRQWLANLAWCQWTLQEFSTGAPWLVMREQMR